MESTKLTIGERAAEKTRTSSAYVALVAVIVCSIAHVFGVEPWPAIQRDMILLGVLMQAQILLLLRSRP